MSKSNASFVTAITDGHGYRKCRNTSIHAGCHGVTDTQRPLMCVRAHARRGVFNKHSGNKPLFIRNTVTPRINTRVTDKKLSVIAVIAVAFFKG
jgi:hypothetical protein